MDVCTDFTAFVTEQRTTAKKPNADIRSRWSSRVVARNLHRQGQAGAETYLRDYGRGISVGKIVAFALLAEQEQCPDLAVGFWAAAFTLETGDGVSAEAITGTEQRDPSATASPNATETRLQMPTINGLPGHRQPGRIVTMQPVDAAHDREHYITNSNYIAQPKRDGNRIVVVATPDAVFYQSRSSALQPSPDRALDVAFRQVAEERGVFILDGERVFLDAGSGEHRTGAQAAQANADLGTPTAPVICQISVFKALFADRLDLTIRSEVNRLAAAKTLVAAVQHHLMRVVNTGSLVQLEMIPTFFSDGQKRALCATQRAEGREGEVWIRTDTAYIGGKSGGEAIVRTKYLTETDVVVTGLTPTTVAGRAFGAIEVAELKPDGCLRPVGSVGTGFSQADARELAHRFTTATGQVFITVIHQGRTENGQLWHARFAGFATR